MAKPPVSEQVQVNFRMPVDLRDRIKAAAEKNGTSMNAELIAGLEAKFPAPTTPDDVVAEIAMNLAFIPPKLRKKAIELLAKVASDGTLETRVDVEQRVLRDQEWADLTFRDDE